MRAPTSTRSTRSGLLLILALATAPSAVAGSSDVLDYEVTAVDSANWVVTAKESSSGSEVKFKLTPAVFKGQTFDADLDSVKEGQTFSIKGSKNASLSGATLVKADSGDRPGKSGSAGAKGADGDWEIVTVDTKKSIVSARKGKGKPVRFKVDPDSFLGFQFQASLKGVAKGEGFSLVAPNSGSMRNCCKLLAEE